MFLNILAAVSQASPAGNNNEVIVAVITAVATAFGSWLLFRGRKSQSEAESVVEERKLLASEWGKFREAVDRSLETCRKENAELQIEIEKLKLEIASLKRGQSAQRIIKP